MKVLFSILMCLTLLSCCPSDFDTSTKRVYVYRVFMHETNRYTFMTKEESEDKVWVVNVSCSERIHLYSDVPQGERMYVEYCKKCSAGDASYKRVDIHIHNVDEIHGGGWDHGKFGRGQTVVVE